MFAPLGSGRTNLPLVTERDNQELPMRSMGRNAILLAHLDGRVSTGTSTPRALAPTMLMPQLTPKARASIAAAGLGQRFGQRFGHRFGQRFGQRFGMTASAAPVRKAGARRGRDHG